jgi:hypothetical protein
VSQILAGAFDQFTKRHDFSGLKAEIQEEKSNRKVIEITYVFDRQKGKAN